MSEIPRRKSPRAPSMALDEALDRALKAYERDRLHPAATELFAQNIGYKGANNGSALQAMASMRYYGLIERPKEGVLAVSKDVESYKFAPDDAMRSDLLLCVDGVAAGDGSAVPHRWHRHSEQLPACVQIG